jgi:acetyl-CoA carboxylase biotin carboxyl carrier protein
VDIVMSSYRAKSAPPLDMRRQPAMLRSTDGRHNPACYTRRGISPAIFGIPAQAAGMARIEIKSEITGTVWKLTSKSGDRVASGDTLIIIESMKMEIPVITEDSGTVKEILVKEKDPVAEGQVVAILDG